jgi:hypothetical protein
MFSPNAATQRLQEIHEEVRAKRADFQPGKIKDVKYFAKFLDKAEAEAEGLQTVINTHKHALQYADAASPYPYGGPADAPAGAGLLTMKSFGGLGRSQPKSKPPSPLHASQDEIEAAL